MAGLVILGVPVLLPYPHIVSYTRATFLTEVTSFLSAVWDILRIFIVLVFGQ